jgi:hypothetical protein
MQVGKYWAKQLDCTTTILNSWNNGIHNIYFSQHTMYNRLIHFTSKSKHGQIHIGGIDSTISKSNHFNQQMLYGRSSLSTLLGLIMIVGLKLT